MNDDDQDESISSFGDFESQYPRISVGDTEFFVFMDGIAQVDAVLWIRRHDDEGKATVKFETNETETFLLTASAIDSQDDSEDDDDGN